MDGPIVALKRLQRKGECRFRHLSASEDNVSCRNWLKELSPQCLVPEDALNEEVLIPKHDCYVACWPCQPYANGGKNKGAEDHRGAATITASLRRIKKSRPKLVLFENSKGILQAKHLPLLLKIVRALRSLDYLVFARHVNLRPWVAQRRCRMYLVAVKKASYVKKFKFPFGKMKDAPSATMTWFKSAVQNGKPASCLPSHPRRKALVKNAFRSVWQKQNINPKDMLVCVDVDCTCRYATYALDCHPTLTATRGAQGGCYLSLTSSKPRIASLAGIQGYNFDELKAVKDSAGVSDNQLGKMLGNAVTGDYFEDLWRAALRTSGLL